MTHLEMLSLVRRFAALYPDAIICGSFSLDELSTIQYRDDYTELDVEYDGFVDLPEDSLHKSGEDICDGYLFEGIHVDVFPVKGRYLLRNGIKYAPAARTWEYKIKYALQGIEKHIVDLGLFVLSSHDLAADIPELKERINILTKISHY